MVIGKIEALDIVDLQDRHLVGALALSKEANWNQIDQDWSMMMAAGNAIGIEISDRRLIASAVTLPYGDRFGWIAMVLVTADWQKQGLAKRLLTACVDRLESQGLVPVLDATEAGEKVYRPLGFLPHFGYRRWAHEAVQNIPPGQLGGAKVNKFSAADGPGLIDIDASVFGGDRRAVIENLIERGRDLASLSEDRSGFTLGRNGRLASQIGPISARSAAAAIAMLGHALKTLTGPVFIDACDHQNEFVDCLRDLGFQPQRSFLRMAKGRAENFGAPDKMFAMAGAELG